MPHHPRSALLVLGAGDRAYRAFPLREFGARHDLILLDPQPPAWAACAPGGLASSVVDGAGFTWDLGGHVVFSRFGEFDRLLAELFARDEDLLHHDRSSYIRYGEGWTPYPFQQHLHHLPPKVAAACLRNLLTARPGAPGDSAAADFATWLVTVCGQALVDRFFAGALGATPAQDGRVVGFRSRYRSQSSTSPVCAGTRTPPPPMRPELPDLRSPGDGPARLRCGGRPGACHGRRR